MNGAVPRLTWHQAYPGGRIVARSGSFDVGAVFPDPDGRARWRLWVGSTVAAKDGSAKSELSAVTSVNVV